MSAGIIAALVVLGVILLILARSVRIVPQARAAVIERLGRYTRTPAPGLTVLVPFVDRMRPLIDLREQVVSFPPQPVITSDNLTVGVDSVIYFQVTDPRAATYEIQNYIQAVEQLTITTLRNVIGSLNLEQALTSRDEINTKLRGVLDEATGPWGIRVARVEIKAIDPPPSIQDAMEQQMRADRNKRALILTAEGQRESAIKTAEGQKAAQILDAEGRKQAVILAAEADRQSRILHGRGRAGRALPVGAGSGQGHRDDVRRDPRREARPGAARLPVPADVAADRAGRRQQDVDRPERVQQGTRGAGRSDGQGRAATRRRSWLAQTGTGSDAGGNGTPQGIDTSNWFDSNLPPGGPARGAEPARLRRGPRLARRPGRGFDQLGGGAAERARAPAERHLVTPAAPPSPRPAPPAASPPAAAPPEDPTEV